MAPGADHDEPCLGGGREDCLSRSPAHQSRLDDDLRVLDLEAGEDLCCQPDLVIGKVVQRHRNRGVRHDEEVIGGDVPGVHGYQAPTVPTGRIEGEPQGGLRGRGCVDPDDHRASVGGGECADHHDRASGVGGDLGADRTEQQPLEAAESARADDEQRRRLGGSEEGSARRRELNTALDVVARE